MTLRRPQVAQLGVRERSPVVQRCRMAEALTQARVRAVRRARAERKAAQQEGIVTRRELYALGMTRSEVRANVRAGRWRRVGRQCVCIHRGALSDHAKAWVAVL